MTARKTRKRRIPVAAKKKKPTGKEKGRRSSRKRLGGRISPSPVAVLRARSLLNRIRKLTVRFLLAFFP